MCRDYKILCAWKGGEGGHSALYKLDLGKYLLWMSCLAKMKIPQQLVQFCWMKRYTSIQPSEATTGPADFPGFHWKPSRLCLHHRFLPASRALLLEGMKQGNSHTSQTSHNISFLYLANLFQGLSLEEYHNILSSLSDCGAQETESSIFHISSPSFQGKGCASGIPWHVDFHSSVDVQATCHPHDKMAAA